MKKKWLIVVVILVIGGLIGFFATRAGDSGVGTPAEGKTETAGTIQVPDGPKIKVVFTGPPELEVSWEKLGMAPDGFQVQVIGTLQNVSNQSVTFSEIGFLFDGYQVDYIPGRTLNPGETMKIMKGFPGFAENTKVLEVKIKDFQIVGGTTAPPVAPTTPAPSTKPTPPPPATTTEPAKPTPTQPSPAGTIFTGAPTNPQEDPAKVVAAFFFLANRGEWNKAIQLCIPGSTIPTETEINQFFNERKLEKIEITSNVDIDKTGTFALIPSFTLYFADRTIEVFAEEAELELEKVDGGWKIEEF